jgi:hypothetical protein
MIKIMVSMGIPHQAGSWLAFKAVRELFRPGLILRTDMSNSCSNEIKI